MQLAQNALAGCGRDCPADRHRREAACAARREGRVRLAARHRRRPERHGAAGAGARRSTFRSSRSACRSSSRRRLRRAQVSPAASSGSTRRPSRARARILVYVGIPNPRQRAARRHVRDRPHRARGERAVPTLPLDGGPHRGGADVRVDDRGRQARQRIVVIGRARRRRGRVEVKTALPPNAPVLAARFDNLKEGAPAIVKAPARRRRAPTSAPTSGTAAGRRG